MITSTKRRETNPVNEEKMENVLLTERDILAKITRDPTSETRIRNAWKLQLPSDVVEQLKQLPSATQLRMYKSFDGEVTDKWVAKMVAHRKEFEANGGKYVRLHGCTVFPEDQRLNTNELLIEVAGEWVEQFVQDVRNNPIGTK